MPGKTELWVDVQPCEDELLFLATAHVVIPELRLNVHARGSKAAAKQAAIQSAASMALVELQREKKESGSHGSAPGTPSP